MKGRIGFITCQNLERFFPSPQQPLFTHDDQLAALALRQHGFEVIPVVWGKNATELKDEGIDMLVVRSPWDYANSAAQRQRFTVWLESLPAAGLRLENPLAILLWNLDKHYLADLAACHVPIVETVFVSSADPLDLPSYLERWGAVVVKPCISAAAKDTFRIRDRSEAQQLAEHGGDDGQGLASLRAGRDFMLQPYSALVEEQGEWSLVFLDGQYSHAVVKKPKRGAWLVQDELGGSVVAAKPPRAVVALATQAFESIQAASQGRTSLSRQTASEAVGLLYGRVDILPTPQGPRVSEVELIEPELFFLDRSCKFGVTPLPAAVEAFCQGLIRRMPGV